MSDKVKSHKVRIEVKMEVKMEFRMEVKMERRKHGVKRWEWQGGYGVYSKGPPPLGSKPRGETRRGEWMGSRGGENGRGSR